MIRAVSILLSCIGAVRSTSIDDGISDGIQALLEADAILSGAPASSPHVREDSAITGTDVATITGPPAQESIRVAVPGVWSLLKRIRDGAVESTGGSATNEEGAIASGRKRLRAGGEKTSGRGSEAREVQYRPTGHPSADQRRKVISDFLIANNRTRNNETFLRLREILRDDPVTDNTLRKAITDVSRGLGMSCKARITSDENSRRKAIVGDFVKANSHMANRDMFSLINEMLVKDGIEAVDPEFMRELIITARRKMTLLGSDVVAHGASREADIVLTETSIAPSSEIGADESEPEGTTVTASGRGESSTWSRRRDIITSFLIANNRTRDKHTFPRLREIFRDDVMMADATLRRAIITCSRDLGMPVGGRISNVEGSYRNQIVNDFVRANSHLVDEAMVPLINAKIVDAGFNPLTPKYICKLIRTARARMLVTPDAPPQPTAAAVLPVRTPSTTLSPYLTID